ncbi:MAG: Cgl0159 family (beta/alpha)8-fold protein [Infirmifilum sp.]
MKTNLDIENFDKIYNLLLSKRMQRNTNIYSRLSSRRRPPESKLYRRGTIILAADHTARMNISVASNKYALINRKDLLYRITTLLLSKKIDGILVVPDILDELLLIDEIIEREFNVTILDDIIIMGSINRGGLAGSIFELDDKVTAYTPRDILKLGLDSAKFLLRIDISNYDTAKTIEYAQSVARECDEYGIPLFLEVFPVRKEGSDYRIIKDPYSIASVVGVAASLGFTSFTKFLKLPYVENFDIVANATTLPIYILGGGTGNAKAFCKELRSAYESGSNVIGAVVGRNILYPSDMSPLDAIECIKSISI